MLATSLALGASICYGVSNFIGPQLARRHTLVGVLVCGQLAALGVCALYVAAAGGAALPSTDAWLAVLAGTGNAGGLIWFYKAAEVGPLSVVTPIGASGAVVPVAWGLASGEALHAPQAAGIVLAMGGAALVARRASAPPPGKSASIEPPPTLGDRHRDARAAVVWAAASALAFGVFLTALPKASTHGVAWALLDARVALVTVLFLWARRELPAIRPGRASALLAVPGVLLVTGTAMYTTAAGLSQLALVAVLGSLFPVVTVGLGVALLGERMSPAQTLGAGAALAGVALIAA
jgi:drug/metabolite transporter (DMT)-like permease